MGLAQVPRAVVLPGENKRACTVYRCLADVGFPASSMMRSDHSAVFQRESILVIANQHASSIELSSFLPLFFRPSTASWMGVGDDGRCDEQFNLYFPSLRIIHLLNHHHHHHLHLIQEQKYYAQEKNLQ